MFVFILRLGVYFVHNLCTLKFLIIKKNFEIQPKILTCEDNYSVWLKENWNKTEYPASPKKQYKNK